MKRLGDWSRSLKGEVLTVAIAMKDPRTPWYAKVLGAGIVAYALSPIDLIPDFIPVLGLLDDVLLIPLGIKLVVSLVPAEVLEDSRRRAALLRGKQRSLQGAALVVIAWLALIALIVVKTR